MIDSYRILIIEDDPNDVELIRLGFEKHDEFFLDIASTGEEGMEKVLGRDYDLVSVDFALPGISGLDVLVQIRELDRDVPVVMVTGRDTEDLQVVAFQKHATSYMAKSVDSFKSLPYVFEVLIKEARFRSAERRIIEDRDRSKAISRYILDNSPVGIYVLQDGCFKLANSKLGEIFGYRIDDLIGKPFWRLMDPENFDCVVGLVQEKKSGVTSVQEFRVCGRDGCKRWVEARIVPVDHHEERWVFGNLIDITKRKRDEWDLRMRNRELAALYNISLKATDFEGDLDDLLEGAFSEAIAGLEGEVKAIFLLENENLVLRSLDGSVEDLIDFVGDAEGVADEALLEGLKLCTKGGDCKRFWASVPIECQSSAFGLVVVGSREEMTEGSLSFLKELARNLGRMVDIYLLRESPGGTTRRLDRQTTVSSRHVRSSVAR